MREMLGIHGSGVSYSQEQRVSRNAAGTLVLIAIVAITWMLL